jgi:ubiquinone/menaquinone biosynthesis C-methylase UbiE
MKKQYFQKIFSEQTEIDYWEEIYYREDSHGMQVRQRLKLALSWLEEYKPSGNFIVLDAGCGAGAIIHEILKKGYNVVGMDHSFGMIGKALKICGTKRKPRAFLQGDIEALPYKNSSFDIILCLGVFAYLRSENRALSELSRVLKPGGKLIMDIVNKARLVNRFDLPLLVKYQLQKSYRWRRSYFIPNFKESLKRNGFSILEYTTIPHGAFTFFGRDIWPKKLNIRITVFLDRISNIPLVDSFGGICMFRTRKTTNETLK